MNDFPETGFRVREVVPSDAMALKALRFAALERYPIVYGTTVDEESRVSEDDWLARATPGPTSTFFVAESESGTLVALAGIRSDGKLKTGHRAELWGVYVDPEFERRGVGDALVRASIAWAREHGIGRITLSVWDINHTAIRLYQRHGFVVYGLDDDAVRVDGVRYDDYLMHLRID